MSRATACIQPLLEGFSADFAVSSGIGWFAVLQKEHADEEIGEHSLGAGAWWLFLDGGEVERFAIVSFE